MDSVEALEALEPDWRALWEADPRATPFQHPGWLLPWTRHLWGGGKIRALALRDQGRLAGLAPLFLWGFGAGPGIVRVSFLGAGITDYLDILALPDSAQECAAAALEWLGQTRGEWDLCDLQELRPDSPLLRVAPPAGVVPYTAPCSVCPVAPLAATPEEHLAGLDSKFRTDIRRAENRLARGGELQFRCGETLLEDLFRLHAARWEERNEGGMLATERLQAFHRESAARLSEAGMTRLYGLFIDGQCIAVQYNIAARGRVYAYLSGFDPQWSKYSPGAVLLKHSLCEAIREGATTFDFLRKAEAFKYLWGARDQVNRRLVLSHSAARQEVA